MVLCPLIVSLISACVGAIIMSSSSSPLQIGSCVIVSAILVTFNICRASTFFALVMLVTYIGGMLVAFGYFLSLCPNQLNPLNVSQPAFFVSIFSIIISSVGPTLEVTNNLEVTTAHKHENFTGFILAAATLFLLIVVVVKIVGRQSGALRKLNPNKF